MRRIALILMALAGPLTAAEWQKLDDAGIRAALTGRTLDYPDAWQQFMASGRTLYNTGADSWGFWEARGDAYCSQWPPADGWACYAVEQSGDQIRFTGESGCQTVGALRPTP